MSIEAQLFAKENVNKLVQIVLPDGEITYLEKYNGIRGIVIGSSDPYVILIQDEIRGISFDELDGTSEIITNITPYLNSNYYCLRFLPKWLQVINKPLNIKPYNRKCKVCKAPSRKCGIVVLCSNFKCSSRHLFKKEFGVSKYPVKIIAPRELHCPLCSWMVSGYSSNSLLPSLTHLICFRDHKWNVEVVEGDWFRSEKYTATYKNNKWLLTPL